MGEASVRAAELLAQAGGRGAAAGLILGSGLGAYAEKLEDPRFVNYGDIPGFPVSLVPGHKNRFAVGTRLGKKLIVMQGRFHTYEGYSIQSVTAGVEAMARLGVKKLFITNAAGGVNLGFRPGELMLIRDHINYSGSNPLIGTNDDSLGPRFPDMSEAYDKELTDKALSLGLQAGIPCKEGVYMMFTGPSFETPAEIRMARILGADAVGMSTVPEVIAARHCGIRVLGVSLITNMAAGILKTPLSHREVIETADKASAAFTRFADLLVEQVL